MIKVNVYLNYVAHQAVIVGTIEGSSRDEIIKKFKEVWLTENREIEYYGNSIVISNEDDDCWYIYL